MTREEAIAILEVSKHMATSGRLYNQAIDIAIEVLSIDAKGDLISRQWLLDLYAIPENGDNVKWKVPLEVVRQNIKDAPSADAVSREDYHNLLMASNDIDRALREYQAKEEADSDRPSGEWTYLHGSIGSYMTISCPFCGKTFNDVAEWEYNYCPSCGTRMKGGAK